MNHSVCFIGHRKIEDTPELRERLRCILTELIASGSVNFIFGDHSQFDGICYETVTQLKEKIPAIKRIHFRKDYENADNDTLRYLIRGFEESIFPAGISKAGRASYVERNEAMIRESDVCIFYYDESYQPSCRKDGDRFSINRRSKSGTAIAYAYALRKNKQIYNLYSK